MIENQNDDPYSTPVNQTGSDPYARIRAYYQQVTGGQYTPTDTDLAQWGTNINDDYGGKIHGAIQDWWANRQQAQPQTQTAPPPAATPPPPGPGSANPGITTQQLGGPNAPGLLQFWDKPFTPPNDGGTSYIPQTPQFKAPGYTPPPAFAYGDFKAPTADEALNDPGYQFRVQQGNDQLQRWAAAKGTLNDSSTAKALTDYGQNAASQEYAQVYGRRANEYMTNRGNAVANYNTNYQTQYQDPYAINYRSALDSFSPQMTAYTTQAAAGQHSQDQNYANSWNRYLFDYGNTTGWQDKTFEKLFKYSNA